MLINFSSTCAVSRPNLRVSRPDAGRGRKDAHVEEGVCSESGQSMCEKFFNEILIENLHTFFAQHDFIVRTRQGIKTTKREVAITLEDVNRKKGEFRSFVHTFQAITAERDRLKAKCVGNLFFKDDL